MNKLLSALLAGAAVLSLGTSVLAADQAKDAQNRDDSTQAQPNPTGGKPGQSDSQANTNRMKEGNDQTQAQPNATKGKPGQSDSQANTNRMKDDSAGAKQDPESVGANDPATNQATDQANRDGTAGTSQNTQGSESDPAYLSELKKCDAMRGDSKSKCITAAKKKSGQM